VDHHTRDALVHQALELAGLRLQQGSD
jgi:hypothetical protein